jgi:hypothetical protein
MKVLGFNFNKISAEKDKNFKLGIVSTNIEFISVEKDSINMLKDSEIIKMDFKFSIDYKESKDKKSKSQANILFEGNLILSTNKDETKNLLDFWKKKQVPENMKMPLLNLILKKCSVKALVLEEELNLTHHIPMPKLSNKK